MRTILILLLLIGGNAWAQELVRPKNCNKYVRGPSDTLVCDDAPEVDEAVYGSHTFAIDNIPEEFDDIRAVLTTCERRCGSRFKYNEDGSVMSYMFDQKCMTACKTVESLVKPECLK